MIRSLCWKPGRQRIELREAGPDADDLAPMLVQVLEPVVGLVEQRLERAEPGATRLWLISNRSASARSIASWISAVLVADRRDLAGGTDQVAQHRLALDDPPVLLDVDRGRRPFMRLAR